MSIPNDVVTWVNQVFPETEREAVFSLLNGAVDHLDQPVGPRLIRCTAMASRGNFQSLQEYVRLLRVDWRDVIVAGEYDVINKRLIKIRDLTKPIS